jgi:hypothetical protein
VSTTDSTGTADFRQHIFERAGMDRSGIRIDTPCLSFGLFAYLFTAASYLSV